LINSENENIQYGLDDLATQEIKTLLDAYFNLAMAFELIKQTEKSYEIY
jgi:hypothetical protein